MKKEDGFIKKIIICAVCLLLLSVTPIVVGDTNVDENSPTNPADIDYYSDCVIWVFGKCDTVDGPLLWKLGFYCPLREKTFIIQATGKENESLNIFIRDTGMATYFGYENVKIDIRTATGVLFWAAQSILLQGNTIFARCKAREVWVTY